MTISLPVKRSLQGSLVALGAPAGWLLLKVSTGASPIEDMATHPLLYGYQLIGTLLAFIAFGQFLGKAEERCESSRKELSSLSLTDPLTGLPNRRAFDDEFERACSLADRNSTALSLLILDIDRFKQINDTFGHVAGDRVLGDLAGVLKQGHRQHDFIARVGGEEFAVILPDTDETAAKEAAERLRRDVETAQFAWNGKRLRLQVSIGVAGLVGTSDELIREADSALYKAKRLGRNRVCLGGDDGPRRALELV